MRGISSIILLGLMLGCSGKPARVMPPSIDANQAGKDAISENDKNGDGQLDGAEFDSVPGVKASLKRVDRDGDEKVSAQEITDRINTWKEARTGITTLNCRVNLDGKPLANADIVFVPEKFLGTDIKPAKGKTGPSGMAMLTIDDPELAKRRLSGAQLGFYKVEITGKNVPSKYNTNTTLGEEVAPDSEWMQRGLVFDLKSK